MFKKNLLIGGNPKIYKDNAQNRRLGRVGKEYGADTDSKHVVHAVPLKLKSKKLTTSQIAMQKARRRSGKRSPRRSHIFKKHSVHRTTHIKDHCINKLSLNVGDYDNYGFNGKYNKCLKYNNMRKCWEEENKRLGFRSEYVTKEQIDEVRSTYSKYKRDTENRNRINFTKWKRKNRGKDHDEWVEEEEWVFPIDIYILNKSSRESEEICKSAGNWKYPRERVPLSNNKLLTENLSKESCVYCKENEPNKVIFRKTDNKWYIQDLHKSADCERTGINGADFYKPLRPGNPDASIFYTRRSDFINPPQSGNFFSPLTKTMFFSGDIFDLVEDNGLCLKEPSELRDILNKIWDNYEAGTISKKEHKKQIDETWEMWNNLSYDQDGWELKHLE